MYINIFSKYNVDYVCNCCYRTYEDNFKEDTIKWSNVMNGSDVVKMITNLCNEHWFSDISFDDPKDTVYVGVFNASTGEVNDYFIKITEVDYE